MASRDIHEALATAIAWLDKSALPLWSNNGFDPQLGLFHERLDFSGHPVADLPRRLMVQCRQISVLAHATLRGRIDARTKVEAVFQRLVDLYYHPDEASRWHFSITPQGKPHDGRCDSYTLAFLVFALSWLYRLNPSQDYLDYADEIFELFDGPLASPAGGVINGIKNGCAAEPEATLSQNPNMHLLEACISLYQAAARPQDLGRAQRLVELFADKMFLHKHKALPEIHDSFWGVMNLDSGSEDAAWYEPGHHFEWIWLLRQHQKVSAANHDELVRELEIRPLQEGVDSSGLAIERVEVSSKLATASCRLWGTCEYLKACASEAENNPVDFSLWQDRARLALEGLQAVFLSPSRSGLWFDRVDAQGKVLSSDVPASSLYHISFAFAECERVFSSYSAKISNQFKEKRRALFIDRDGVINVEKNYAHKIEQIDFLPGIIEGLRAAEQAGFVLIVVTNQSGVGRALYSEADVLTLHRWMDGQLRKHGVAISAWYHSPHHETAGKACYQSDGHYDRKPNPGMLHRAALDLHLELSQSLMVGDRQSDVEAARAAGVTGHLFPGGNIGAFIRNHLLRQAPDHQQ